MRRRAKLVALAACTAAILLSACGGGDSGTASMGAEGGGGNSVTIKNFAYAPADVTVSAGTTVKFTNDDSTNHTATANGGGFDTGTIARGQTRTVTLQDAGTFSYVCTFHPFMHGTITVK